MKIIKNNYIKKYCLFFLFVIDKLIDLINFNIIVKFNSKIKILILI
jgi:hypothetical protein